MNKIYIASNSNISANIINQLFPGILVDPVIDPWNILRETKTRSIVCLFDCPFIVPPDICKQHLVVNFHPADIITYTNLKGREPIEKFFKMFGSNEYTNQMPQVGIIHKVESEVNDTSIVFGQIEFYGKNVEQSKDEALKAGIILWIHFLNRDKDDFYSEVV